MRTSSPPPLICAQRISHHHYISANFGHDTGTRRCGLGKGRWKEEGEEGWGEKRLMEKGGREADRRWGRQICKYGPDEDETALVYGRGGKVGGEEGEREGRRR